MASPITNSGRLADSKQIAGEDTLRALFGAYFPQLFAYARSITDDDVKAREIVVESFTRTFACPNDLSDQEFPIALFGAAREICREAVSRGTELKDALSTREREVVALVFDAQLSRAQIASLLRLKNRDVGSALLRGLRKLRAAMTPAQTPAFFRLS